MRHLLLLLALLLTACGGSNAPAASTPVLPAPPAHQVVIRQRALPPGVSQIRAQVFDARGQSVFGPTDLAAEDELDFGIPESSATLSLQYLQANGTVQSSFVTQIDPTNTPVLRIEDPKIVDDLDPITLRFAFYGCNRLGFSELSSDNPSSANRAQLRADFQELPRLQPPLQYVFILGDLVTNEDPGTQTLISQLQGWLALTADTDLLRSSIPVGAITGNHEILTSQQVGQTGQYIEFPNPATLPVWQSLMGAFIKGSDGPTTAPPNLDQLTQDQSQLSYTVRLANVLFILVNTDTFINETTIGDVPLNWLSDKLAAGQADPSVEHIFVLGHKPILASSSFDTAIRAEEAGRMEELLAATAKVRGYLCAHSHLWQLRTLGSGLPQVIAGNAGSPVEPPFDNTDRGYFGYTLVAVHASGKVHIESWGRQIPNPYNSDAPQPPATLRVKQEL